jgi:hypothetical protein
MGLVKPAGLRRSEFLCWRMGNQMSLRWALQEPSNTRCVIVMDAIIE